MIESCLQRTEQSFQSWLKKTLIFTSTDYVISIEMCAMVNVILDAKNQSFKLCSVDGIDVVSYWLVSQEIGTGIINQLILDRREIAISLGKWRESLFREQSGSSVEEEISQLFSMRSFRSHRTDGYSPELSLQRHRCFKHFC